MSISRPTTASTTVFSPATADFDFVLPPHLIAQHPAPRRDASRLLIFDRRHAILTHSAFPDLPSQLRAGDVLVLNNSRVIPARLRGAQPVTGGKYEILLLEEVAQNDWWTMLRPGKRARLGSEITLLNPAGQPSGFTATVREINPEGHRRLTFTGSGDLAAHLDALGELPLPPYIARPDPAATQAADRERYQTVYAATAGSVAAPTAGLHFTPELLAQIRARGVAVVFVTLHVGAGTFAPVKTEDLAGHTMHEERYYVGPETADTVNAARTAGGRIFAVGTTSVRVLETVAAAHGGRLVPGSGRTRIFLYPPCRFQIVDALLTNFHLPRSTLLMLVSAFAAPGETTGREHIIAAYTAAITAGYRFFSYGDAMLIL